jgi:hypothetical protein
MFYVIEAVAIAAPVAGRVLAAWTTFELAAADCRGRRKRAALTRTLVDRMQIIESQKMFMRAELVPLDTVERAFTADGEPIELVPSSWRSASPATPTRHQYQG